MSGGFAIECLYRALVASAREGRWGDPNARCAESPLAVHSILRLPVGDHPEGVTVDQNGNVYLSNRRFHGALRQAEVLKVTSNGRVRVLAKLPDTAQPEGNGVLGLVADGRGSVFAALDSRDPASRGVWRIGSEGSVPERLAGSQSMTFPNALVFDNAGNLYATDSDTGAIWRFPPAGLSATRPWFQDELLAPFSIDPFGIPLPTGVVQPIGLPGANGIAFHPPNHLYVANTEKGLVVHVPIETNGNPGAAHVIAGERVPPDLGEWLPDPRLWTLDGISVDDRGDIHCVVPGFGMLSQLTGLLLSPLVRVTPGSGEIHSTPTTAEAFDIPLSLAFGRRSEDQRSVYVVNSALFPEILPGPGPGLIRAEVERA